MDPKVRYASPAVFDRALVLGPLTDRRIEHYQRAGRYQRGQLAFPDRPGGRLVYPAGP